MRWIGTFLVGTEATKQVERMAAELWETDEPSEQQMVEILVNDYRDRSDLNEYETIEGWYRYYGKDEPQLLIELENIERLEMF